MAKSIKITLSDKKKSEGVDKAEDKKTPLIKFVNNEASGDRMTVRIMGGDTFIRLPHRMLYVEDGEVSVTRNEYELLRQMKVC
ncbi:MAG: hypothetical protein IJ668_04550 [Selenomonadaceae bacterium]|nr:hypothetical protein [Selenomonadaceae bacterium]